MLANYLEEYDEVPWDALRYLFAIINYGGHITDDWDKRVLIAYINQFFCEEAHDTPFYRYLGSLYCECRRTVSFFFLDQGLFLFTRGRHSLSFFSIEHGVMHSVNHF